MYLQFFALVILPKVFTLLDLPLSKIYDACLCTSPKHLRLKYVICLMFVMFFEGCIYFVLYVCVCIYVFEVEYMCLRWFSIGLVYL
jgi:hypothetical protein